ncbi:hypothetical protein RM863_33050 [Streptomyces sp. DSM 41014]|uniref:Serine/threonine protein kinase n=1 Tax=Streptomyces hintoniae TaxID=3075521 RepID=A0ABU2UUJ6_9ACTN|nr:hypothetical protein [Streptomyces sp. DSM 41014]MDT0476959.1 hypothetical protein [Streptomyces sp. DSM 41014]
MGPVRRVVLAGAGLVGALVLTACGGGDDGGGSGSGGGDGGASGSASSPAASASASADGGSGGGGSEGGDSGGGGTTTASDGLQGSWLATTDGKAVALVITGKQAGLFVTGGTVCSGSAGEEAGRRMIHLTCTKGDGSRATGMVDSVDKSALKVTWSGKLGTETYTRAEGGKLPSGLPTAGLGQ